MQIWPAIDLLNGQAVRLTRGDYDRVKVYFKNPNEILKYFQEKGARHLHVVDLDGAREGTMQNFSVIERLTQQSKLQIEVGGGIRDEQRIRSYLDLGVSRVILGTAAAENLNFLREMVSRYGSQIVVGVDAKDGMVALRGWREISDLPAADFCLQLQQLGVSTIIYTDIAKDGGLQGTNLPLYQQLIRELSIDLVASGGITYLEEIEQLRQCGLAGAIVGKALYEGRLDLTEVIRVGGDAC